MIGVTRLREVVIICGSFSRKGYRRPFCHSHIRSLLFNSDTESYMNVTTGWFVSPTLLVVASDDIVIMSNLPGGTVPGC